MKIGNIIYFSNSFFISSNLQKQLQKQVHTYRESSKCRTLQKNQNFWPTTLNETLICQNKKKN